MKILLDLDGVMIPVKGWKPAQLDDDQFFMFSPNAIEILRQFITRDTQIVLTTSHKSRFRTKEWISILNRRGLPVRKVSKLNRLKVPVKSRKEEVLDYLMRSSSKDGILILDDDRSLNDLQPEYKQFLVQTNTMIGLRQEHIPAIEAIVKAYQPKKLRLSPSALATATKPTKGLNDARSDSRKSNT